MMVWYVNFLHGDFFTSDEKESIAERIADMKPEGGYQVSLVEPGPMPPRRVEVYPLCSKKDAHRKLKTARANPDMKWVDESVFITRFAGKKGGIKGNERNER